MYLNYKFTFENAEKLFSNMKRQLKFDLSIEAVVFYAFQLLDVKVWQLVFAGTA